MCVESGSCSVSSGRIVDEGGGCAFDNAEIVEGLEDGVSRRNPKDKQFPLCRENIVAFTQATTTIVNFVKQIQRILYPPSTRLVDVSL